MPQRRARLSRSGAATTGSELAASLAALREEFEVPAAFSPEAIAEAERAQPDPPALDLREIGFVTLDPAGSRDLDQAFHLARENSGWTLRYAIADLPGFIRPGGALDEEARRRGQTLYLPDATVPLHPPVLSEDRASLLPGVDRAAYVWTIALDTDGEMREARVEPAQIRSRERWDYANAQAAHDAGGDSRLAELAEFAGLRIERERARGGASLAMPDEEIIRLPDDGYRIERRFPLPIEAWNAQLSLLTGMAAARIMLDGGVGVLRTMPPPDEESLRMFRERVRALGRPWDADTGYGDYLRTLEPGSPAAVPVLQAAASLFRGADYAAFDGTVPEQTEQAAIAAPYAHVTAPLRRLVDRWGLVICEALCAGREAPAWARESLPEVPALMRASNQRAGALGQAALDRVEAALLQDRRGEALDAVVVEVRGSSARVQIDDPAVTARCPADGLEAGTRVRVRVVRAEIATGEIELALEPAPASAQRIAGPRPLRR